MLDAIASKLGHGSDEDMLADLQRKAGLPVTGKKPGEELNAPAHDEHEVDEDGRIITGPHGMMDIEKTPTGMKVSRKNWSDQGGGNGVDPKFHLPSNKGHWSDYDNGDYNDEHEVDEQGVAEEMNLLRRAAGLKENVTLDENGQTLQHILTTFKRDIKDFKATGALSDHLYDALFDYYAPDMPYGVAKARTGDPDQWIADRFGADIGMLNFGSNSPSVNHEETESVGDYAEEVTPEAIAPVLECNMSPFGSQCPVHGIEECVTAGLMEETAEKFDLDRLKALANIR